MMKDSAQLSNEDYRFICQVVYDRSRICLGSNKKPLVASRLAKRLRYLRLGTYHEYCRLLRSGEGEEELGQLINQISTNHTHFFREQKHFNFLREVAFPQWSAANNRRGEPLRVWSAACSTGEEVYSLAIWLAEYLSPAGQARWHIEGTDISSRVIEVARAGVYAAGRLKGINLDLLRRYFQKGVGAREGEFRVKQELRDRVQFQCLNLVDEQFPFTQPFDIIFCRNVMIYFDKPTQELLVKRLTDCIAPGGYLMVGHSESLSGIKHSLRLVQPAVYTTSCS